MPQVKKTSAYILESLIISSTRMLEPINIGPSVSDIEIFEHMDLAYLTGQVALIDTFRLYDRLDFQGAEYCTIKMKQTENSPSVEKRFVIDKLLTNKKANEQTDMIMFHIIEDTVFSSNLKNVNKAYTGTPSDIITKLSSEWLNKKIINLVSDIFQKKIKVIIPNMTPMNAIRWIQKRGTTSRGYPTYLFSSFTTEDLVYVDLKTLMDRQAINKNSPFLYGPTQNDLEIQPFRCVPIKEYNIENVEDMYSIIDEGLVGAEYQFIDTHLSKQKKYKFNVANDVFKDMSNELTGNKSVSYAIDFDIDEVPLQDYLSRKITRITESGAYDDTSRRYHSYDEEVQASDHSKKIIANALKSFLVKTPITIRVDGAGFIDNESHYTTGNIVRILFLANRPTADGKLKLDLKKSGDYLVYRAKHAFGHNRYYIHLTCVKLTYFTDDNPLKVMS